MRTTIFALLTLSTVAVPQTPDEKKPAVKVSVQEFAKHCAIDDLVVRSSGEVDFMDGSEVTITIDPNGKAAITDWAAGWKHLVEAQRLIGSLQCEPFVTQDLKTGATVSTYIPVLPIEKLPKSHVPFPKIKDWKSLNISLIRTGCFGTCPAYTVTLHGDGSVLFEGRGFVAVKGNHRDMVSQETLASLVKQFTDADWFSLDDKYMYGVTDMPTYKTCIAFDKQSKCVTDYAGEHVGMPNAVSKLEEAIDRAAGTEKWIKGNAETVSSLQGENWDFKSPAANKDLLKEVAASGSSDTVTQLLTAGVPLSGGELAVAARRGDTKMVSEMIAAGAGRKSIERDDALLNAVMAGKHDVVVLLLANGADPAYVDPETGFTVLMAAAVSGKKDMAEEVLKYRPNINERDREGKTALMKLRDVRSRDEDEEAVDAEKLEIAKLLLKNGADMEIRDKEGQTALFSSCYDTDVVKVLLENGANVNALDDDGLTPLMDCNWMDTVKVLLEHGANPWLRDKKGKNALERAVADQEKEKVALLHGLEPATPSEKQ